MESLGQSVQVLYVLMTLLAMMQDCDYILLTEWYVMTDTVLFAAVAVMRTLYGHLVSAVCRCRLCFFFQCHTVVSCRPVPPDVETLSAFVQQDLGRF